MCKFSHTLTRKLQSPLEPSERNFMMSDQEGDLIRQAMALTIDSVVLCPKMRGWITPQKGYEKSVQWLTDLRYRAKI